MRAGALLDDESGWSPEIELIDGIEVPKMSPKRRHAKLEGTLMSILRPWAGDRGEAGVEWRFDLGASTGHQNSYVPDVAYGSIERLGPLDDELAEQPPFAPDIAIEIRSPGDRERNIAKKIARYLEYGGVLVLDVDPAAARITAHSASGTRTFAAGERCSSATRRPDCAFPSATSSWRATA